MKTLDSILSRFENGLCIFLFIAMTLAVCSQVVFRRTGISVQWTEEISRYFFVWLIYLGAAKAVKGSKHLKVDILSLVVKKRGNFIFSIIGSVSSILFWVILSYYLFQVVNRYLGMPQLSASLKINMAYMYAAPLICGILSLVHYIQEIIFDIQKYRTGSTGEKGVEA